jgi:hypothetical protein
MINWMLAGVLAAVLSAELLDAWALRRLARQCQDIHPNSPEERRLVRWYAQGFGDACVLAGWLSAASLALAAVSLLARAHPGLIAAATLLAAGAYYERCMGANLLRRFRRAVP